MTKVLIAVDDTSHSVHAAATAHSLFGDDVDYLVINVSPRSVGWGGSEPMLWGVSYPAAVPSAGMTTPYPLVLSTQHHSGPNHESPTPNAIDAAEQTAGNVAAAAAVPSPTVIGDTGDATAAILEAAATAHVDVIVVGASHASWSSRLFSRPVADGVRKNASCPVLVV
jgi:nucleotide-binding universal stress UspA family protein